LSLPLDFSALALSCPLTLKLTTAPPVTIPEKLNAAMQHLHMFY